MPVEYHPPGALLSRRLPGWILLSALAHLLVLSLGGGTTPARIAAQNRPFIADIRYISPEIAPPDPASQIAPESPEQLKDADPPPQFSAQQTTTARTPPKSVVDLPFPLDPYLSAREVDVRAQPVNEVLLVYPWVEYKLGVRGVVQLTLLINEHGGLDRATVIKADPPGVFEDAALEAVNKLHFKPALKNNQPVKSRKTIDVVFDPTDQAKPAAPR